MSVRVAVTSHQRRNPHVLKQVGSFCRPGLVGTQISNICVNRTPLRSAGYAAVRFTGDEELTDDTEGKVFFIQAYYEALGKRIEFLRELHKGGHGNEALTLCCCYIEALGNQRSDDPRRKVRNYCAILDQYGGSPLFGLVHPVQAARVLESNGLFQDTFDQIEKLLHGLPKELLEKTKIHELLAPILNQKQTEWLADNIFKFTISAISYDQVRSELVHDISAFPVSFSETTYQGEPVPTIDFPFLYAGLRSVFAEAKRQSIASNSWWWER